MTTLCAVTLYAGAVQPGLPSATTPAPGTPETSTAETFAPQTTVPPTPDMSAGGVDWAMVGAITAIASAVIAVGAAVIAAIALQYAKAQARSAETQARSAEAQARSAEAQARSAEAQAKSAEVQAEMARRTVEMGQPSVKASAYIEKPCKRVRIRLRNDGGVQVTVRNIAVVQLIEGRSNDQNHREIPTEPIEYAVADHTRAVTLQAHDSHDVTLRRPDGSRFDNPGSLRVFLDIAGEEPRLIELVAFEGRFDIPGA
jgi:hypothetical protein